MTPPDATPTEKPTTTYVVLRYHDEGDTLWEQLPGEWTVPAGNKKAAIKAATADLTAERKSGAFHAVTVATWGEAIPRTVKTEEVDAWG